MVVDLMAEFKKDLAAVINKHGIDNRCNTPDFVLAEHVSRTLLSLSNLTLERDQWFGFDPRKVFEPNIK